MAPNQSTTMNNETPAPTVGCTDQSPKIITLGSSQALLQKSIVQRIIKLSSISCPNVLFLSAKTSSCELTDDDYKTCTSLFSAKKCHVKCHNLVYSSIQEDLDSLLTWANVVICNWNEECNKHDVLRTALFSNQFILCATSPVMNAILDEKEISHLTEWTYCPAQTAISTSHEAPTLLTNPNLKRIIGIDPLAAHIITGNDAMAISGNKTDAVHIYFYNECNEITSTPLPISWEEPIPAEELVEFHEPATNPHLETLEEFVKTDFVIADEVIPEISRHKRTNSHAAGHQKTASDVNLDEVFPKIVAAGKPSALQLGPIFDKVLELSGKELPNLLFIGTASFDRTDKFNSNTKRFREIGCDVRRLDVSDEETVPALEEMRHLVVDWADVIMCAGGNTLHALLRWKEVGLDLLIKEASMKGTVLCGGSAGAGCWFSSLHTDSLRPDNTKNKEHVLDDMDDEDLADWDYTKISALGFVDAMCVPHFDVTGTNGNARSDDAEKMLEENPTTAAIGVDENAAFVVVGDEALAVSGDGKATCHIVVPDEETGEVISAPLPTSWQEPVPLEEVLEFPVPATNPHLETLEDFVKTDFVIADDVIPVASHHRRTNSQAAGHQKTLSEVNIDEVFPKIVAAGKPSALQLGPIFDKVLELSGKELPNLLFIGTASFDRTDKFNSNTKRFREIGCDARRLDVSDEETVPTAEEMRHLVVDWADVIMCAGGNTLHALLRWKEVGLDLLIKEASMKGTVLCGGSAGAGCWFSSLHTDSLRPDNTKNKEHVLDDMDDEDLADWDYTKISALGFVDAMCVPHFDVTGTNGNARSDDAEKMLEENPTTAAIGVDENAAFVVVGDEALAVSGDGKATCHIVVPDEKTGEVISAPLPTSWQEPVPLEEVLEFPVPATNPHLETLEEFVKTDFVIADEVIPEISRHKRTNSHAAGHHKTPSEINLDEVFPKIVAAGKPSALQLGPIFDKVLELSGKELPNLLFIGTASFDRTDKFNSNTKRFREIGCNVRRLDVSDEETVPTLDEMRHLVVDWADIIMCAGGNTLHALLRWKEVGLDLLIKEASMKGTVLCGGSAGAGCWFSSLHTDSLRPDNTKNKEHVLDDMDDEDLAEWDYTKISALGFIDAMCVPHFDVTGTNGNARSDDAEKMLEENPTTAAIGVDENAAFVVVGDEALALSGDGTATCHVVVPDEKTGEVISAPLPTSWQEPVPLEEVLDFPVPATNPHLESLEEHINTDFVVADDIPETSSHSCRAEPGSNTVFPKIVAAGRSAALQMDPIFNKVIELSGKELPNLLFIGTASFDRTDRFNSNTRRFREIGCDVRRLEVSDEEAVPTAEEMREMVVDWADAIMCSGGNTLHALIRWKEVGLDLLIKESGVKGTVLCGGSAGAGCWFSSLHSDSLRPDNAKDRERVLDEMDDEDLVAWDYTRISGLGFIDAMCVPHFDATGTNGQARCADAEKFLKEDPSKPAIGIDGNAALVVLGDDVLAISGDGKATCHVVVLRTVTEEILSSSLPKTLEEIKKFHSNHNGLNN